MELDILAFGAHPDDVELSCSGTLAKHVNLGYKVGIVDLTRGELGTRGSGQLRLEEAEAARKILGVHVRENLEMRDGFFEVDEAHILSAIKLIRKYKPGILIANAVSDRHPDHGRGAELLRRAFFLSGLPKIKTELDGVEQKAHRPRRLLHYIQFIEQQPDLIIGIDDFMDLKMKSILAYGSQFYDPNSDEPNTLISGEGFLEDIKGRASKLGLLIGKRYGEGFITEFSHGIEEFNDLL